MTKAIMLLCTPYNSNERTGKTSGREPGRGRGKTGHDRVPRIARLGCQARSGVLKVLLDDVL